MKIRSLCKSKYDDRVDFCFRDGTPLVPAEEEPAADVPASDDLYSSATRPFIVQPDGTPEPVAALDVPEVPDRFAASDGLDVPEPQFGFDDTSADAPEAGGLDSGGGIPQPARTVVIPRRQPAVGQHRQSPGPAAIEASDLGAIGGIPQPDCVVGRPPCQAAIGQQHQCLNPEVAALEPGGHGPASQIPQPPP